MLQCRPAQEFSFGPRALKDALVSTDAALRKLYATAFSPAERLFLAEAYNLQGTLFCSLQIYTASDWLLSRPEAPEDFQAFYQSLLHRKQNLGRKHIYLQPIDLSEGPVGCPLLDSVRSCTEAFFRGLRVKCLPSVAATSIHCSSRPRRDSDRLQFHTDGVLSFLKSHKPDDALCVLGLTLSDLYPRESWSFTFSKFLPGHEVGVCSFARFSGEFLQLEPGASDPAPVEVAADDPEAPGQERVRTLSFSTLGMVQCCKATCHELCHLLGLGSCRWLGCIMQGALSLDEALRRPPDLCPICLRKLQHLLGFRLLDRYQELYAWTQTMAGTWPSWEAAEQSGSEDMQPFSTDSGLGSENDSEALTSLSEPLTPDGGAPELEPTEAPSPAVDLEGQAPLPRGPAEPMEALQEYGLWLAACIQALEREVSEEELARLDEAVDSLSRWDLFTGQLPATRQALSSGQDCSGLRKALGGTLSSWRRKLGSRKPAKVESPPCHWRQEED
ncbi:archaemetzincin-1 [Trichechus inunguis]|uniref:Archaemetzincin-1 n=1 Tax=Trichechus manatus latirostris TaxID=127582 RepID=A0A2Y9E2Y0_TRIMA|nr:archaemetzincin-1 [Trichechus manatus latirostris]